MRRFLVAIVGACLLSAPFAPQAVLAKDALVNLELDGRPLDAGSPSAIIHHGRVFVNVVRITKGFNGLLTFGKNDASVRLSIGKQTALFVVGKRTGTFNGQPRTFSSAPFILNGDTFVPLEAVADLANATLVVDTKHHVAHLTSEPVPVAT